MEGSRPDQPAGTSTAGGGSGGGLETRTREHRYVGFSAAGPRRHARWYSRFVGAMKVLLPLIALVLIALVVLWPHLKTEDLSFRIGFAALNLSEATDPAMINPRYVGTDKEEQPYTITADLARRMSDDSGRVELEMPKADITLEDGTWLVLTAQTGLYDRHAKTLDLTGKVNLYHDAGYEFLTSAAKIDLAKSIAYGTRPVHGQGPFGQLNAEGFRMTEKGNTIHFTGKSKLVLYPGADQEGR
jgi:lipopolysaccharide export system protein LptC